MSPQTQTYDVVVIGAGLAGAATAFFLSRTRGLRVLVLEKEIVPGVHSSGRNASLVRTACGDPWLDAMADEGARFLRNPPPDFPGDPGFRASGSFLVGSPERLEGMCPEWSRVVPVEEVQDAVPVFQPAAGSAALHTPTDGVVDVHGLLLGYLKGATQRGVEIRYDQAVTGLDVQGSCVTGVQTGTSVIASGCVVIAAGAWAGGLGRLAGAGERGLRPTRRHLLMARANGGIDPDWPYVWDLERGFYFRPEPGGVLVSACDQVSTEPGDCPADDSVLESLAEKSSACVPTLAPLVPLSLWAGIRTLGPESRFLLGRDREVGGLVWAAGLGGHGVTASAAVGRVVSEAVLGCASFQAPA